jgi:hypothetical protein
MSKPPEVLEKLKIKASKASEALKKIIFTFYSYT